MTSAGDLRYAWYAATVLAIANTVAFVDRTLLSLLLEPIKADLQVSDTAMGMLHGLAFAAFYSVLGVPIARLADRSTRRTLIAWGVLTWSVATALCGLARGYGQLFAARVAVGAGEAALSPAAYSMLADYFPREQLPRAMGLYASGIYVGGGLALLAGGALIGTVASWAATVPLLAAFAPWQVVFLLVGAPGVLLACVVARLREPQRRASLSADERSTLGDVCTHVASLWRVYAALAVGFTLLIMLGYGTGAWWPAFLARTFDWSVAEIGVRYGLVVLVCGAGGAWAGGALATWLHRRGHVDANLRAPLYAAVLLVPCAVLTPLASSGAAALAGLGAINFLAAMPFGGGYAALQQLTPPRLRAQVSALFLLCVNLLGVGLGPVVVGLLTDHVFADPSELRFALAVSAALLGPVALAVLAGGLRPMRHAYAPTPAGAGA